MTPPIEIVEPPTGDEDTEKYEPDTWVFGDEDEADTTALHESELAAKENANDGEPALATPAHQ